MAKELRQVTQMVWHCLSCYPETRNSDKVLIRMIYDEFFDSASLEPLYVCLNREELPKFETIRRCRQKIQEEYPELRAVPEVEEQRIAMQKDFIEYSQEEVAI